MSSDSDLLAFQNSVESNEAPTLFQQKNWTFVTDSTSNSGNFTSGQIQFDLSTFNSQSQWLNLSEAVIEFPIKITTTLTTAGTGNASASILSVINKNGFHNWINSCQLVINGQTLQSSQPYENVSTQFRILSSWSKDTKEKYGKTLCFELDDMTGDATTYTSIDSTGLTNATFSTVATSVKGFDCVNNQSVLANKGPVARAKINSNTNANTTVAGAVLGTAGIINSGLSNGAAASATNTAGTTLMSMFLMGTIRLKDICDLSQFPMTKNLKGFLYISFNSAQTTLTFNSSGAVSNVSYQILTGATNPYLINTAGITAPNAHVITITGNVDGTTTGAVGNSSPILQNAKLICPYYIANPKFDGALSKSQRFSIMDKIVNPVVCPAGQTINVTLTAGTANPRRLVLLPMWQNLGGTSNLTNPEFSAFDTAPSTSGPFAFLNNLQVYVGNKPIYQNPISYDFEQFMQEQATLGLNGNQDDENTSGLLNQQLWSQNHRFYSVDLSRGMESEDGMSKSVQISFTNPSTTYGLKVIAIIYREKKYTINTATCTLSSGYQ